MRVIAGTRKGHVLLTPAGREVRPTSDRARTMIFDILGDFVTGARVLDVFAGAGTLGIEALSRGAEWVDFIDKSQESLAAIQTNLSRTHLEHHGRVILEDAFLFLARPRTASEAYKLILADPPYGFAKYEALLQFLQSHEVLADGGLVMLETSARLPAPHPERLELSRERLMGETVARFYRRKS
ncbi:MAG: 16S rRNA (guanine(966)-N(2))-methyltransferase RsmD [bacterium]